MVTLQGCSLGPPRVAVLYRSGDAGYGKPFPSLTPLFYFLLADPWRRRAAAMVSAGILAGAALGSVPAMTS